MNGINKFKRDNFLKAKKEQQSGRVAVLVEHKGIWQAYLSNEDVASWPIAFNTLNADIKYTRHVRTEEEGAEDLVRSRTHSSSTQNNETNFLREVAESSVDDEEAEEEPSNAAENVVADVSPFIRQGTSRTTPPTTQTLTPPMRHSSPIIGSAPRASGLFAKSRRKPVTACTQSLSPSRRPSTLADRTTSPSPSRRTPSVMRGLTTTRLATTTPKMKLFARR